MKNPATTPPVGPDSLIETVTMRSPELGELMERVRRIVRYIDPTLSERVRYGGVMFGDELFGVFPRKNHVTVEFSHGIDLEDPDGVLKGAGKYRRHIILRYPAEIETTHLADYFRRTVDGTRSVPPQR